MTRQSGEEPTIIDYLKTPETVLEILSNPDIGDFTKEDGEVISTRNTSSQ